MILLKMQSIMEVSNTFCYKLSAICFGLFLALSTGASFGYPANEVVRIVNGNPISSYDVAARLQLIYTTSGRPDSAERMEHIRGQVLETLIDERLQIDEANRLGIKVGQDEIQSAIRSIEQSNGMPADSLLPMLSQRGVDVGTLAHQIEATLAWRKVIAQRAAAGTSVSDADIDEYYETLTNNNGGRFLLSEIFVAATRGDDPRQTENVARELRRQLQGGAAFASLARQFSQSPTAVAGGDLGWVEESQLDSRVIGALATLRVGEASDPIAVDDGFYIYLVRDRKTYRGENSTETYFHLGRYFKAYGGGASNKIKDQINREAASAYPKINGCDSIATVAAETGALNLDRQSVRIADIPQPLRPFIEPLQVGGKTKVLTLTDGALIVVLCGKEERETELPDRTKARETLLQRRYDIEARRYLRELRHNALVESGS